MKRILNTFVILLISLCQLQAQKATTSSHPVQVQFVTNVGKFTIELSNLTPRHRDNFLRLVEEKAYKDVLFHRVIDHFMVQTGNLQTKDAKKGIDLSEDSTQCTLSAEIVYPELFHRRGAVAAAREGDEANPEMRSSCTQFYVVTGKYFTAYDLDQVEKNTGQKIPTNIRQAYMQEGGSPHLDKKYTVFGYIVSGHKTIEKISSMQTDGNNRPFKDIKIKEVEILKP